MVSDTLVAVMLSAYLSAAGDHASLYQGSIEPQFLQNAWVTHPYWEDTEFRPGSICYDGILYPSVQLRYNIYDNRLAVVSPDSRINITPEPDKVAYFVIDGFRYEPLDGRYVRVASDGQNAQLLHMRIKERRGDEIIDMHAYHSLQTSDTYYLRLADGSCHAVSNLKSLCKAVPQFKHELQDFARANKLRFKGEKREPSLVQCVRFLEQLGMSEQSGKRNEELGINNVNPQPKKNDSSLLTPNSSLSAAVPGSVFADIAPVDRVAAYYVYTPESRVELEYADDDMAINTPGVDELETLRETRSLSEVEIVGFRQKVAQMQTGVEAFRPSMLRNVPLAMGEADVLKVAMLLPGVSASGEASSGLNVRGGASDQNLMLYNGNTIFNPMHMFGIFSAFNPDMVAESELYKGGIPSQYGGRLSSVMNIKGRTADKQEFHGSASVGLVTTKAMLDVPLVKDRASLLLGGRATYSDWMLKKLNKDSGYRDGHAGFWDASATLNTLISRDHSLNVNGYYSQDRFSFTEYDKYRYTNMNFSAELRSRFGNRLTTNVSAGFDHYDYANDETIFQFSAARLSFDLNQFFLKASGTYELTDAHSLNIGLQGNYYHIMPGKYYPLGEESYIVGRQLADDDALESALWAEDTWKITDQLKLTGGVRLNLFKSFEPSSPSSASANPGLMDFMDGLSSSYIASSSSNSSNPSSSKLSTLSFNPDLRISASYQFTDNQSIKAGFNTLHQYIHKVSNTVIMSPTDTWVLTNSKIKPQSGWQVSAGYYWQSDNMTYEFSAETYYKGMDNYLTYRSAAQLTMNEELYKDVVGTQGRAYGLELQIRKLYGKFNGWLSYTYARTQLRQQGDAATQSLINRGKWFSADYDCPHEVKLVSNYKFTRRYSTSLNANYSSGRPFTAPVSQFYNEETNTVIPIYSERNECRMPYYLRLDWSFNIEPSHHLTNLTHSWFTVGVYNLLGRRNAYSIYYQNDGIKIQGYKLSIFGAPIPYINYNIKF